MRIVSIVFLAVSLAGCSSAPWPPEKYTADPNTPDRWWPAPGYTWVNLVPGEFEVKWNPGSQYLLAGRVAWPNVVAADEEGKWQAAPGYTWGETDARGVRQVEWNPGSPYSAPGGVKYPHVHAAATEGHWAADPGYELIRPGEAGEFAVRWAPGRGYWRLEENLFPWIASDTTEGIWSIWNPYYVWARPGSSGRPKPEDYEVVPRSAFDCYKSQNKSGPACARALQALTDAIAQNASKYAYYDRGALYVFLDTPRCAAADFRNALLLDREPYFAKYVRQYIETTQDTAEMEKRWMAYLKGVQAEGTAPNWKANAYELQLGKQSYQCQT